ncbi:MAG: hypothetical protein QM757_46870 [Paludibaculum sp.]
MALTASDGRATPFQRTESSGPKPLPVTVKRNGGPPAVVSGVEPGDHWSAGFDGEADGRRLRILIGYDEKRHARRGNAAGGHRDCQLGRANE